MASPRIWILANHGCIVGVVGGGARGSKPYPEIADCATEDSLVRVFHASDGQNPNYTHWLQISPYCFKLQSVVNKFENLEWKTVDV